MGPYTMDLFTVLPHCEAAVQIQPAIDFKRGKLVKCIPFRVRWRRTVEKPSAGFLFLIDDKEWNLCISEFIWPAGTKYHPGYQEQYFVLYGRTLDWSSKSFPL